MQPPYASIDLETTGLDPASDAIIEVGIVQFAATGLGEMWSTLVNPQRRVPPEITQLTGITQAEVDRAPLLSEVRALVQERTDGRILVAHRVDFDLQFLRRNGLCQHNGALDTHELATILLPTAGRYSLNDLARRFDIDPPDGMRAHRGPSDAHRAALLFRRLFEQALSLPVETLAEIVEAGRGIGWSATGFFEQALGDVTHRAFQANRPAGRRPSAPLFQAQRLAGTVRQGTQNPAPIDLDEVCGLLEVGGQLAQYLPNFEHRPQQTAMARAVGQALNDGAHLMVEAGTGTGKSIAYLLPALYWAVNNDDRVVVSTNTINLQDQLVTKDIPDLRQVLPLDFQAAVLKGRGNYICPRLVTAVRRSGPADIDQMRLLAKLLVWLPQTTTGERDELNLQSVGEQLAWSRLSAENEGCAMDACAQFPDKCPVYAARSAAETAHVVVVNHALLLSDIVTGNRVLPSYRHLVVDEAHHLEDATTNGLSFTTDQRGTERLLAEITHGRGLANELLGRCRATLPPPFLAPLESLLLTLLDDANGSGMVVQSFFWQVGRFLQEHAGPGARQYSARVQVTRGLRIQPGWTQVEAGWELVSSQLAAIGDSLDRLLQGLEDVSDQFDIPDGPDLVMRTKNLARTFGEVKSNTDALVFKPSDEMIYWAELPTDGERVSLHAAPLHVGPLIEKHLFHQKRSVILTSATLQTRSPMSDDRGGFQHLKERLHAWDADELAVGSPFDFKNSTLLYLPTDMPEPSQPGYQRLIESSLVSLSRALRGRLLVLFTSHAQLRQTGNAIRGALSDAGIALLQQGLGGSRRRLVEDLSGALELGRPAVLLGTRSFWEGIDVPGPALSGVVIVRLPFDVPSDPIFAARQEGFDNPFYDYAVPEAVLRFRQGFGRLIRARSDRGAVICLDKRLLTKAYGRFFLEALPDCTVQRGNLASLAPAVVDWLNRAAGES